MKKLAIFAVAFAIAAFWCRQSFAQSTVDDADYLSKETENPVTRKITLPLRYEADFLDGADKLTKSTIELDQAVVPFRLNDDWSLITRTKLPAEALPPKKAGERLYDVLSVAGARPGLLLGSRTSPLLSGDERGARHDQMGLRSVRSIPTRGQRSLVSWPGCQQHLVVRRRTRQQQQNQPAPAQSNHQLSFRGWMGS
jgi:hypothetical protein